MNKEGEREEEENLMLFYILLLFFSFAGVNCVSELTVLFWYSFLFIKLNIQKTKIMASGPITSWEIDGEIVETVSDFIVLGSKITVDGDCSHEIKRHSLEGKL